MNTTTTITVISTHRIGFGGPYIGSCMVKHLLRRGCDVVTFDGLPT